MIFFEEFVSISCLKKVLLDVNEGGGTKKIQNPLFRLFFRQEIWNTKFFFLIMCISGSLIKLK